MQPLDSVGAGQASRVFSRRMVSDANLFYNSDHNEGMPSFYETYVLERFLTHVPRPEVRQRSHHRGGHRDNAGRSPASLGSLRTANEPLPCRLSTQDLVELLKMPTCIAEVRRVILDQLGNRYGRRFDTHWDFVRYAQERRLSLDFTTPPQCPDPKLPPLFQE